MVKSEGPGFMTRTSQKIKEKVDPDNRQGLIKEQNQVGKRSFSHMRNS